MVAVQESSKMSRPHRFPLDLVPSGVGGTIKAERGRRRWSQELLARRAKVARASVYRLEAGERPSRADTIFRLAHALELDMRDLVPEWPEWEPVAGGGHGPRTRARRRELGLTLAELAAAAGVSEATLSRHERGMVASPALLRSVGDDLVASNEALALALGFADACELERYCCGGCEAPKPVR